MLCGLGLPVPEDIILVASGFLAEEYEHSLPVTASLMYCGILLGDGIIYLVGRHLGQRVLATRLGRWVVKPESLPRVEKLFHKYGSWVLFVGRFLPGLRAPIFLTAGTLRFPWIKFFAFDGLAALISAPLFVWLGHFAGERYAEDLHEINRTLGITKFVVPGIAVVVGISLFLLLRSRARREPS